MKNKCAICDTPTDRKVKVKCGHMEHICLGCMRGDGLAGQGERSTMLQINSHVYDNMCAKCGG